MNEKDDIILEYLNRIHPAAEPPILIYFNIQRCAEELDYYKRTNDGFHIDTLRNRLKALENSGLVENIETNKGYRVITDDGRAYLQGNLDASELED